MVKKKHQKRINECIKVVEAFGKYWGGIEKDRCAVALFRKEGKPEENMILLNGCRDFAKTLPVQDKLLFAITLFEKE